MATGGAKGSLGGAEKPQYITLSVSFESTKAVLHIPKDLKVGEAIQKAAVEFKQPPQGLTFLYHGLEITDDMEVGVALGKASACTVIHMVKKTSGKLTGTLMVGLGEPDRLNGYCNSTCESIVYAREVLTCKNCGKKGHFQRRSSEPLDHFAESIPLALLKGSCNNCNKDDPESCVSFECTACDEPVVLLRQVRDNKYQVPCIKCGLKLDKVFRFTCPDRHCICLSCFDNMCKMKLGSGGFKHFEGMGYNTSCPVSKDECKHAAVPDPHHFYIVGDERVFYQKFQDKAFDNIVPQGDNILCSCKTEIDMAQGKQAEVEELPGEEACVSGLKWYQKISEKIFRKEPKKALPRTRRKTSCRKCSTSYCVECKSVWHNGDCPPIEDVDIQEQLFPVEHAHDGRWPADKP